MKHERGFTLVEVVAAIVIIGIGFLPMYAIFERGLKHTTDTQAQLMANELAEQTIEYIKGVPYSEWVNHDNDKSDGQKEVTFTATAGSSVLPVTIPAAWSVDVTLSEKAFDSTGSYAVENRKVDIQQVLIDGDAWLNVNGQLYSVATGTDFPWIKLVVTKDSTASTYTLEIINQQKTDATGDDVVLYTQTTSEIPECHFYFSDTQKVTIEKDELPQLAFSAIKEDMSATTTMTVNTPSATSVAMSYYQLCTKPITEGMSDIKIEATNSAVIFTDTLVASDTITLISGYKPIIRLEPDTTVLTTKKVNVSNKRIEPLDIEVTSNLLTYIVDTGLINKRFYTTKAQGASHMLYACEVVIEDQAGVERVNIRTTKKE